MFLSIVFLCLFVSLGFAATCDPPKCACRGTDPKNPCGLNGIECRPPAGVKVYLCYAWSTGTFPNTVQHCGNVLPDDPDIYGQTTIQRCSSSKVSGGGLPATSCQNCNSKQQCTQCNDGWTLNAEHGICCGDGPPGWQPGKQGSPAPAKTPSTGPSFFVVVLILLLVCACFAAGAVYVVKKRQENSTAYFN